MIYMKIKRIRKLKVNSVLFDIKWDNEIGGASFSYSNRNITFGVYDVTDLELFEVVCHELFEIVAIELAVRFKRPDCDTDYVFVFDHRQHSTMMCMFSGLLSQFIKG